MDSQTFPYGLPKGELGNIPACSNCGKHIGPGEPFTLEDTSVGKRAKHATPLYFDECALAARNFLSDLGFCVVPSLKVGTPDTEWLAIAGDNEWTVVTQDAQIMRRADERAIIIKHNVKCFILPASTANKWEQVRGVVSMWDKIRMESAYPGPFVWRFNDPSHSVRWEQLYPDGVMKFGAFDLEKVPVGHLLNLFADVVVQLDQGWFDEGYVQGLHENIRREIEARIANDRSIAVPADNSRRTLLFSDKLPKTGGTDVELEEPVDTTRLKAIDIVVQDRESEYIWLVPGHKLSVNLTDRSNCLYEVGPHTMMVAWRRRGFCRSGFGLKYPKLPK